MPRRREQVTIPIPPDRTTKWSITIDGDTIPKHSIRGKFSWGVVGEELDFDAQLDNNGEDYTDKYSIGSEVIFLMDFDDGSTKQFLGQIDSIKAVINDSGFVYDIIGSHTSIKMVDITITESYTNTNGSDVLKDLIDSYLTGYTYTNVQSITTSINKDWVNKSMIDAVTELAILCDCDIYVDNNKDFHMFTKNSIVNEDNSIVYKDALLELRGLGTDGADVKNKIIVYGDSDGLPVINTKQGSNSQTKYGVKDKVITDNTITDESVAEDVASAELSVNEEPSSKGSAETLFLDSLRPGDNVLVLSPPHKVHSNFRVSKFSFMVPDERMDIIFSKERSIPQVFKDRINKDESQESLQNPFKMEYSYNFPFDNYDNTDEESSNNITISDGKIKLTAGATGTWISKRKTTLSTVTKFHLKVKGEVLGDVVYYVNCDGTDNWQLINLEVEVDIDEDKQGTSLGLKAILNSASTEIDAMAGLYK